jgi:isopenicillin N synthase-like dioxygenase
MSPHRLCRYSNGSKVETSERNEPKSREIFGAHTDSTFITVVPVALVPGLEVYDEAEEKWYRPEKAARIQWENEERARDKDTTATTEVLEDGTMLPWCARYAIMIPGELLQLVSRSEVLAAVHRVVVTQEQSSRLSAPILVRGRSGISMNATRYLGGTLGEPILVECEGMKLRDIHDKMQARPS